MRTRRGLSVALALAVMGAAPVSAQQPQQHQEGHDHAMPQLLDGQGHSMSQHEGLGMMMEQGTCAMMSMAGMMETGVMMGSGVDSPAADARVGPRRVRRPSGPSRLQAAGGQSLAAPTAEAVHVGRERVRRFSGPSHVPPALAGRHMLGATQDGPEAGRRPTRRPNGPSRIPRG